MNYEKEVVYEYAPVSPVRLLAVGVLAALIGLIAAVVVFTLEGKL